jgi:DNA-binding PadR family transcriptional regulator
VSKKTKDDLLLLSALEQDLLTLLNFRSLYGLEFVTAFQEASQGKREIGFGSLYPTLARMEKKGLVTWRWGDEQKGPRRKYYDITPYGKSVLQDTENLRKALGEWASNIDANVVSEEKVTEELNEKPLFSSL